MTIQKLNEIVDSPEADLVTTIADALHTVPFGRIVVSLYKIGAGVTNYLFFKKFARFLDPMSGMEDDVDEFLERLSLVDREKLEDYMLSLLAQAESTEKAQLMGFVFKSAVRGEIDNMMMLRLVSIVSRVFIFDLKELPKYLEETEDFTIATNAFINLGLIDNETGGYWKEGPSVVLNEIGRVLYEVLNRSGWFESDDIEADHRHSFTGTVDN